MSETIEIKGRAVAKGHSEGEALVVRQYALLLGRG
jgi:hypothetical protein